jgi:hypothetical protein
MAAYTVKNTLPFLKASISVHWHDHANRRVKNAMQCHSSNRNRTHNDVDAGRSSEGSSPALGKVESSLPWM